MITDHKLTCDFEGCGAVVLCRETGEKGSHGGPMFAVPSTWSCDLNPDTGTLTVLCPTHKAGVQ